MKIFLVLSVLLIVGACSSTRKAAVHDISLSDIESLRLSEATKDSIADHFGMPSNKRTVEVREIWEFEDSTTGAQRLSVEFDKTGHLVGILWIPRPEESERNLKAVFSRYANIQFKAISTKERYHSNNTETVYSDNSSMSVLYDDNKQKVEALSWFLPNQKTVQSQAEAKKQK